MAANRTRRVFSGYRSGRKKEVEVVRLAVIDLSVEKRPSEWADELALATGGVDMDRQPSHIGETKMRTSGGLPIIWWRWQPGNSEGLPVGTFGRFLTDEGSEA